MQTNVRITLRSLMRLATRDAVTLVYLSLPVGAGRRNSQGFIEVVPFVGIQAELVRRLRPSTSHSSSDRPSVECIPLRGVAAGRPNGLISGRDELAATR